jgi:hypothetical protein
MGLKNIIKFLTCDYEVKDLLTTDVPDYYTHPNRRHVLGLLRLEHEQAQRTVDPKAHALHHYETEDESIRRLLALPERSIHEAPEDFVSSRGQQNIGIHLDPSCKCMVVEDWMLALRAGPHKTAQRMGYTSQDFYNNLIRAVRSYSEYKFLDTIVLVVDKGSPPEKRLTQEARKKAFEKSRKRKRGKTDTQADERHPLLPESPPPFVNVRDKKRKHPGDPEKEKTNLPASSFSSSSPSSSPPSSSPPAHVDPTVHAASTEGETKAPVDDLPLDAEVTPSGIRLPSGEVLPMDAPRLMSSRTPGLRLKLYHFLREQMTNDDRLANVRILFDYDVNGPWLIHREVAVCLPQYRNSILEADNACFWWAQNNPNHHVFIHAGDTDYLAIALLNSSRFHRPLVVQIRDDTRGNPICMEAHWARSLLVRQGVSEQEFVLACILNGTDFVDRSTFLHRIGPKPVWAGVALYKRLSGVLRTLVTTIKSRSSLLSTLNKLLRTVLVSGRFEGMETGSRSPTWPSDIVRPETPWGVDAVVCCIYMAFYGGKRSKELTLALRLFPADALVLGCDAARLDEMMSRCFHPVLETQRVVPLADPEGSAAKPRGLPPWTDPTYQETLRRIRFNFWYWATLGSGSDVGRERMNNKAYTSPAAS